MIDLQERVDQAMDIVCLAARECDVYIGKRELICLEVLFEFAFGMPWDAAAVSAAMMAWEIPASAGLTTDTVVRELMRLNLTNRYEDLLLAVANVIEHSNAEGAGLIVSRIDNYLVESRKGTDVCGHSCDEWGIWNKDFTLELPEWVGVLR